MPPTSGDQKASTAQPLFTVQGPIVLRLEFQIMPISYWNLTNVVAQTLNVGKGTLLPMVASLHKVITFVPTRV